MLHYGTSNFSINFITSELAVKLILNALNFLYIRIILCFIFLSSHFSLEFPEFFPKPDWSRKSSIPAEDNPRRAALSEKRSFVTKKVSLKNYFLARQPK